MKFEQFVTRLSAKGYTRTDSRQIIHDMLATITEALVDGEQVNFHGFGRFTASMTKPRESVSVVTHEKITIQPHKVVRFSAGQSLKDSVEDGIVRIQS